MSITHSGGMHQTGGNQGNKMGWISKLRNRDRGANLVEFAVVAPLLFLLLFGIVEFARVVHGYTTVWTAAREGARHATTVGNTDGAGNPDTDDEGNFEDCDAIVAASLAKLVGPLTDSDIAVTYFDLSGNPVADCDTSTPDPDPKDVDLENGYTIEVEASATFDAVVPLLSSFLDGIDLTSTQSRSIFKGVVGGS